MCLVLHSVPILVFLGFSHASNLDGTGRCWEAEDDLQGEFDYARKRRAELIEASQPSH